MTSFVLIVLLARNSFASTPAYSHTVTGYSSYSECSIAATKLKSASEKGEFKVQEFYCLEVK